MSADIQSVDKIADRVVFQKICFFLRLHSVVTSSIVVQSHGQVCRFNMFIIWVIMNPTTAAFGSVSFS